MTIYLHDIPLADAWKKLQAALQDCKRWQILGTDEIPLDENACGRVTAGPVWARISSPHYHASAMDGFAVKAVSTTNVSATTPVTLLMGSQAIYVDTGDQIPAWADAVAPIETVEALDENMKVLSIMHKPHAIRLRSGLTPWMHVRPLGEDIIATQLVLPAGHTIRPFDLGAVAAAGINKLSVSRKPRVAIIPTGNELVPIGKDVRPGEIIEYNSIVLAAQVEAWGAMASRYPIVPDNPEVILESVRGAAFSHDLILLNAGSSAGSEDFSATVINRLGEVLVHGVAIRPGHPVILGMVHLRNSKVAYQTLRSVPIIGVPGYPVSAALTAEIFVEPLISRWLGRPPMEPLEVTATLVRKVNSPAGDDDFIRVAVGRVGSRLLAAPLSRGAGVITSLVKADGICIVPRGIQGINAGEEVKVRLYRHPSMLERVIFAIGSHDMTLDMLAQYLAGFNRSFSSTNVGSLGGLIALKRREAHMAGSHLLDPETGEYNIPIVKEYLPETPVQLITWVGREQGLITLKGNPKRILSLDDLTRPDVNFINRQRGSGTRVLLDFHLKKMGISQTSIQGYIQEEYNHLAVAAAVASGRADTGMGVAAAASALDLDFVPLFSERYDLVIPLEYADSELLTPLFQIMHDAAFRGQVAKMPGYDVSRMGNLVFRSSSTAS